jgi:hypothetical protein
MHPSRSRRRRWPLAAAGGLVAAALAGLAAAATLDAEVVATGHLLPWDPAGGTRRIETLGVTLYLDEEFDPNLDVIDSWAIVAISTVCAFAALLARRTGSPARHQRFLALLCAGTLFLAFDETLGLHETIGHNLRFLGAIPGIDHPDDAVLAAYAVAGLAVLVAFRDLLLASRPATLGFAAGIALGLASVLADVSERVPTRAENAMEIVTSLVLLGAVAVLALELVSPPAAAPGAASAAPGTPALRPS